MRFKANGHLLPEGPLSWGRSLFVLFRPSTDWVRPTHMMEGHWLYPKSTNLNVNLIKKKKKTTFTDTSRVIDRISRHGGPAKLTHKIKHPSMAAILAGGAAPCYQHPWGLRHGLTRVAGVCMYVAYPWDCGVIVSKHAGTHCCKGIGYP